MRGFIISIFLMQTIDLVGVNFWGIHYMIIQNEHWTLPFYHPINIYGKKLWYYLIFESMYWLRYPLKDVGILIWHKHTLVLYGIIFVRSTRPRCFLAYMKFPLNLASVLTIATGCRNLHPMRQSRMRQSFEKM